MTVKLAFVDTETTGLDPDQHEIWEVGLIVREVDSITDTMSLDGTVVEEPTPDAEYVWQLPVDLARADPYALNVGRFHERRWNGDGDSPPISPFTMLKGRVDEIRTAKTATPRTLSDLYLDTWAGQFAKLTWGAHLVGAVPSFDEERLRKLLRANGTCPGWHYHLIDIENLAVGYLAGRWAAQGGWDGQTERSPFDPSPPWKSEELSKAVGVDPEQFDRHTALGDAKWAVAIYDQIVGGTHE